jgi:hypothetical protein
MGTLLGDIPAKVSVIARANVTAGFAKDVEDVKPVGAGDESGNCHWDCLGLEPRGQCDDQDKTERRNDFTQVLASVGRLCAEI